MLFDFSFLFGKCFGALSRMGHQGSCGTTSYRNLALHGNQELPDAELLCHVELVDSEIGSSLSIAYTNSAPTAMCSELQMRSGCSVISPQLGVLGVKTDCRDNGKCNRAYIL